MEFTPSVQNNKAIRFFMVCCVVMILCADIAAQTGLRSQDFRVNAERIMERIEALSEFGRNPKGGVNRVAFSEADYHARAYIVSLMKQAGLSVQVDAASNIIGRREGTEALPAILLGSHIDSVPEGGNYDGSAGVLSALECIEVLQENSVQTRHPIEVIVFTDEEGGLIGSRGMIGRMTPEALAVVSHSGKSVAEGIRYLGGNPDRLVRPLRSADSIKCFVELHIEQGNTLYTEKIDIGVVEGIVGIHWWDVTVSGKANHAGTTPMHARNDALLAAARFVIAVNEVMTGEPGTHVGTVGKIAAEPGAPNVIPGRVSMSLELRDLSEEMIDNLFEKIEARAREIEDSSGTQIVFKLVDAKSVPAPVDDRIRQILLESGRALGYTVKSMPSGAGHDAQNMAKVVPTGMIFIPSVDGISHSPLEYSRPEDLERGANVMLEALFRIDEGELN